MEGNSDEEEGHGQKFSRGWGAHADFFKAYLKPTKEIKLYCNGVQSFLVPFKVQQTVFHKVFQKFAKFCSGLNLSEPSVHCYFWQFAQASLQKIKTILD